MAKQQSHDAQLNQPGTVERMLYPTLQRLDATARDNVKRLLGLSGFAGGGVTSGVLSAALAHALVNAGHLPAGEGGQGTTFGAGLIGAGVGAAVAGAGAEHLGGAMAQGLDARMARRRERYET